MDPVLSTPRSTNQLLPKEPAAPGEDAAVLAAGGSWLPSSCQTSAKPFPYQGCPSHSPSPAALSRGALPSGCSQPEQGDSLGERSLHHAAISVDEVTHPHHRVRTLHRREMSALLKQTLLYWETTSLLTCSSKHIPQRPVLGSGWSLISKEGVGEPQIEGRIPYPCPASTPGESLGH